MSRMILVLFTLILTACNTMEGLNKDLKIGGDKIRESGEQIGKSLKTQ